MILNLSGFETSNYIQHSLRKFCGLDGTFLHLGVRLGFCAIFLWLRWLQELDLLFGGVSWENA